MDILNYIFKNYNKFFLKQDEGFYFRWSMIGVWEKERESGGFKVEERGESL